MVSSPTFPHGGASYGAALTRRGPQLRPVGTCKLIAPRGDASYAIARWLRVCLPWGYFEGSLLFAVSIADLAGAKAASAVITFANHMGTGIRTGPEVLWAIRFLRFPQSPVHDAEVGKGD